MQRLENYITEMKKLFCLALPLMLAQLFNSGKGMVDTMMVGNIDKFSLAGLSLANGVFMLVILFGAGVGAALVATLSRLYAQKDFEKMHFYGMQGVYLNTIIALFTAVFLFFADSLFHQLGNLDTQTTDLAGDYLKVLAIIWPFASLLFILRPILQSFVKNKEILYISGAMFIMNIPLNYIFIYDLDMGAIGSAYATAICFIFEVAALLAYILKSKEMNIFSKCIKIDWYEIRSLLKLGTPIGLSIMLSIALFTSVTFMLAEYGEEYVGAHHLATNFLGFVFMFGLGLNFALVQRVSFFIGLNQVEKIKLIVVSSAALSVLVSLFTMCMTYAFRYQIADIYTNNEAIIAIAVNIFVISMLYQMFDSLQAVGTGILRAYKLNRQTFMIALFTYWVIGFGSGYYLSQDHGIYGYWYGFCICFLASTILYFRKIYKVVWKGQC
tara:strand:- start:2302 stop:3621 length:1320 start_codon:yes stop_codon:yes gene_type:complete